MTAKNFKYYLWKKYAKFNIAKAPFYKKYKQENKIELLQKDGRGMIDFELGFFYNRIPKAANSTIVASIAEIKFARKFSSQIHAKQAFKIHPRKLNTKQLAEFEKLFKFTFVRNPYTRILSAYLDKIVSEQSHTEKLKPDATFSEFLQYLCDGGIYANAHWAPQSELLLLPIEKFDYIGKVEKSKEDIPFILKKIFGMNQVISVEKYNKHSTDASKKINAYYTRNDFQIINQLFKEDFELFDYEIRDF